MPSKPLASPPVRPRRADAQRNRERIIEVAREAFTAQGSGTTMDDIARRAGVGPGTLYRHFATREDLIEAVYRSEVEKLAAAGDRYASTLPPVDALRTWMLLFVDHVVRKLLILPAMDTVPGGSKRLIEGSRSHIYGTFYSLVQRAIDSGGLRKSTVPDDLVRGLIGVFQTTYLPGWEASARRIVDILVDGSRATSPPVPRRQASARSK